MTKRRRVPTVPAGSRFRLAPGILLALFVLCVAADVYRLGWFADDFHLLDVARRIPNLDMLNGQYGIGPWYRPLSRELFYEAIVALGPFGLAFAHAAAIACLFGCAWALLRIAARLLEPRVAPVAPALFVTYEFTKFLTGWSAGFQDLSSQLLILLAFADFAEDRRRRALIWAALATFAKESGFIVLPLFVAFELLCRRERRWRDWLPLHAAVWLACAGAHVLVRLGWGPRAAAAPLERSAGTLLHVVGEAFAGFVGRRPVLEPWALLAGVAAGTSVFLLLREFERDGRAPGRGPRPETDTSGRPGSGGLIGFLAIAAAGGFAPLIASLFAKFMFPHAYYAFPASPWLVLMAALGIARLPKFLPRLLIPALAGWNTWCLAFSAPNLSDPSSWDRVRWDWNEAMRLSALAQRFTADIRNLCATRPESLVVVYRSLPVGCFFQTEDGPATREALGDPTVRSYFMNLLPLRVERDRSAFVVFDLETLHLVKEPTTFRPSLEAASEAIMRGSGWLAYAIASAADTVGPHQFVLDYTRAAGRLIAEGPAGFAQGLNQAGLGDTLGTAPDSIAWAIAPGVAVLREGIAETLHRPLSAESHARYASRLVASNFGVSGGVEYRIALALDPSRAADRMNLGVLLAKLTHFEPARAELNRVLREVPGTATATEAQRALTWIESAIDSVAASRAKR